MLRQYLETLLGCTKASEIYDRVLLGPDGIDRALQEGKLSGKDYAALCMIAERILEAMNE